MTANDSGEPPRTRADVREALDDGPPPPPRPGGAFGRLLDGLSGLCMSLASVALVVLVAVFGWLVFGRYVLNDTPTWVEQLALLLVIAITFLGSAALVHEDRHLGVTFMRDALPRRPRLAVRLLCDVSLAAFGVVMALVCAELVAFAWGNKLPMLGVPEGTRSLPAVVCGALVALFAGTRAVAGAIALFSPPAPSDSSAPPGSPGSSRPPGSPGSSDPAGPSHPPDSTRSSDSSVPPGSPASITETR